MKARIGISRTLIVGLITALAIVILVEGAIAATEIRVGMWGIAERVVNYQKMMKAFEKENPDIHVKLEYAPWGEYWQKMQTQIAAGMAPDVIRLSGAYAALFIKKGQLKNLQPLISRDKFPIDDPKVFVPDLGIFKYRGERFGIPEAGDVAALYYNKDLFKEAGVAFPNENWKWSDLLANAKKLTRDQNGDGNPDVWGVQSQWTLQVPVYNFLLQNNVTLLNEEKTKSLLDSAPAVEAVQFLVDLIHRHKVAPKPGEEPPGVGDIFLSGKIAMVYRLLPQMVVPFEPARFDWDVCVMPSNKRRASETNWIGWGMNNKTKAPDAAWRLIKFLAEQGSWMLAENRDMLPPLKAAMNSGVFLDPKRKPAGMKRTLELTLPNSYDLQFTPRWGEWVSEAEKVLQLAFIGQMSASQACKEAASVVNRILQEEIKEGLRE